MRNPIQLSGDGYGDFDIDYGSYIRPLISYEDLVNKPSINKVTFVGNREIAEGTITNEEIDNIFTEA